MKLNFAQLHTACSRVLTCNKYFEVICSSLNMQRQ